MLSQNIQQEQQIKQLQEIERLDKLLLIEHEKSLKEIQSLKSQLETTDKLYKNQCQYRLDAESKNENAENEVKKIFKDWELSFEILIGDDQIPIEVIKLALDHAGQYVGIGDFRPGKGGKFGKFIVTEFKES